MPETVEGRFVHPMDVKIEKRGFFMGYGQPKEDYYDYEYASYRDGATVVEQFPGFIMAVMGSLFVLSQVEFYGEMIRHVAEFDWTTEKPDIYMVECGAIPIFVSNHIPEQWEGYKTNFKMIADHSQRTADHCIGEDENGSHPE